jgi:hypothetical protein
MKEQHMKGMIILFFSLSFSAGIALAALLKASGAA